MKSEATIAALRDLDRMRLQARRDSEAMAAGIAAFRRYSRAESRRGEPCEGRLRAIEKMVLAERHFDESIEECDAAMAILRGAS
jgi:hypothetical protein